MPSLPSYITPPDRRKLLLWHEYQIVFILNSRSTTFVMQGSSSRGNSFMMCLKFTSGSFCFVRSINHFQDKSSPQHDLLFAVR